MVPDRVTLDGKLLPLIANTSSNGGLLLHDAFNSVGYHRLQIGKAVFLFATEDSKLGIGGIREILDYLEAEGLSWGSQLFFAGGARIRDPRVDMAWLDLRAAELLDVARTIAAAPRYGSTTVQSKSRGRGFRVERAPTLSLLRQDSRRLLERYPAGPLELYGQRYAPVRVVEARSARTTNTPANRRLVWLIRQLAAIAAALREVVPPNRRASMSHILADSALLLRHRAFASFLHKTSPPPPAAPGLEERVDARYTRIYEIYKEMRARFGWTPSLDVTERFAYVQTADLIYQTFVALVIARAFGVEAVSRVLLGRLATPSFRSEDYDIYYDTNPPRSVFPNWRDKSSRPTEMRPDLVIVDRRRALGILLDAKYRIDPSGEVPMSALADCQVYMQSFGTRSMIVCYPNRVLRVQRIEGDGNCILAVSVAPRSELGDFLREVARPEIARLISD